MTRKPLRRGDNPFDEFDQLFEDMQRRMDALFDVGMGSALNERPKMISYARYEGPEGVREYTGHEEPEEIDEKERPLIDVNERGDKVMVLMQLPGVGKEDIDLTISGKMLHVAVDTEKRSVEEDIALPCGVKPSTIKASYRNGVLEVQIEKASPKKRKGKKVTIE